MGRNIFGWDYPPGAEHDPNAPWNQTDESCCVDCGEEATLNEDDKCEECADKKEPEVEE